MFEITGIAAVLQPEQLEYAGLSFWRFRGRLSLGRPYFEVQALRVFV